MGSEGYVSEVHNQNLTRSSQCNRVSLLMVVLLRISDVCCYPLNNFETFSCSVCVTPPSRRSDIDTELRVAIQHLIATATLNDGDIFG